MPDQKRVVAQNIANNAQFINNSNARVNASIEQTRSEMRERSQHHLTPQEEVGYLLRDQTPYHDPNSTAGNPHVVEGSPQYVKTDGQGNFDTTNNPTDNPNDYRDGHWVDAEPVKPSR